MAEGSTRKRAGFTLLTALAFSLVVGTVLAGVGTVAMSHYSRSGTESDYASAVAIGDAGVNFEIRWISLNPNQNTACDSSRLPGCFDTSDYAPTGLGLPGSVSVHAAKWDPNTNSCVDGTAFQGAPNELCVVATGTVNGISRKVYVHGKGESAFGPYAIYAYNVAFVNGTGASGKVGVDGNMGSNGNVKFTGALGTNAVIGNLVLNGPSSGLGNGTKAGSNVQQNPDAVLFPTVSQVASELFPNGGLTYLQTHNNNANIMMLKSSDPTLASITKVSDLTSSAVTSKLTTAGFTTASRTLGTAPLTVTNDSSTLDSIPPTGTRFVDQGDSAHNVNPVGINGDPVYFLPPGDYYLSDLSIFKKESWVMLTHLGAIRIWVDSSSGSGDDISNLNVIFTAPGSPQNFRLYYNKCGTLKMDGGGDFDGSIYAMKNGCTNGPGIDVEGNNAIAGSVIANTFTLGGNSWVVYPNNGGGNTGDPVIWYGFKDSWKEIRYDGSGNPVFVDGTSN